MSRTFCFGCSYTQYMWPTWADIVQLSERERGNECWNFGMCGISNSGIATNINIADSVFNFTPEDKILIVWTSLHRIDRLETYWDERLQRNVMQWQMRGSIFGNDKPEHIQQWIKHEWQMETDIMNNWTTMRSIDRAYKPDFQGHIREPLLERDVQQFDLNPEIAMWYRSYYTKNKHNLFDIDKKQMWNNGQLDDYAVRDPHPCPVSHLKYAESTGIPITDGVKQLIHNWQDEFISKGYTAEQLTEIIPWRDWEMPRVNCITTELNEKYGIESGADIENYVWLWKQVSPSTILNKII